MTLNKNLTAGIMVDWFRSDYSNPIIEAICKEAENNKIDLLYFIGTRLKDFDNFHQCYKTVYRLIETIYLDYLIVLPGVTITQNEELTIKYFQKFRNTPILTLGFKLGSCPGIFLDNKAGFRALVKHLCEDHKRKKLVFLNGPPNSFDAEERFSIFKEVLAENSIFPDERFIVHGGYFLRESGVRAAAILLDERKLIPGRDFDAVVSANDFMALGMMDILLKRGYNIPDDVVFGGFDDSDTGKYYDVGLTTVQQDIPGLGKEAIRYVIRQQDNPDKKSVYLPTKLIIRESCGCNITKSKLQDTLAAIKLRYENNNLHEARKKLTKEIIDVINNELGIGTAGYMADELMDAFFKLINDYDKNQFLLRMNTMLSIAQRNDIELNAWNYALAILKNWLTNAPLDKIQADSISILLDQCILIVCDRIKKTEIRKRIDADYYQDKLRILTDAIIGNKEIDEFPPLMDIGLSSLGFKNYYLFIYDKPGVYTGSFRLKSCYPENTIERIERIENNGNLFKDFQAVFDGLLKRESPSSWCILPLAENTNIFGFLILDKIENEHLRNAYENITAQISSTLRGSQLLFNAHKAYEELKITQQELQQELDVTHKLQEAMLPTQLYHLDFEIAACMLTAISVGGDYYDFICTGANRDWIVIGDVSGHGVYAGLIMMMVQTSIHLILKQEPQISPTLLLTRINYTLTENIKKLGDMKYMTILALVYENNGRFTFSGMNLPFYIYRQKTQEVEIIETEGFWLGLLPDISQMNKDSSFILEQGDCLLLFTDGITEAENKQDGHMYTDKRLYDVFGSVAARPVQEILDRITADLSGFTCDDDVTLFVLKKV